MRPTLHCAAAFAALAFARVADAADPATGGTPSPLADDPVLMRLVGEALESRPELKQARSTVAAERERVPQAGALPDPTLSLGIQNDSFNKINIGVMETSWWQVMITQPLPWPGKRGLRTDVAEVDVTRSQAAAERARLTTEADVRRGYVELLRARDGLVLLGKLEALWRQAEGLATARYRVGEGPQSDLLRAQLEQTRLRQRRRALEADERTRVQALNRLRNRLLDEPIATSTALAGLADPPLPTAEEAMRDAEARSPDLAQARAAERQATLRVDLARRERYPDFSVTAGVMPRGSLEPMWLASVGVTLPIWSARKQWRAVAESEASRSAEAQGAEAVLQILRLRTQERLTQLGSLLEVNQLYRRGLLVQSDAAVASTLAQYRVGRVPFAAVLEVLNAYVADQQAYLDSLAEAQRVAIAQEELSLEPTGGGAAPAVAGPIPGAAMGAPAPAARPGAAGAAPGAAAEAPAAGPAMRGM